MINKSVDSGAQQTFHNNNNNANRVVKTTKVHRNRSTIKFINSEDTPHAAVYRESATFSEGSIGGGP